MTIKQYNNLSTRAAIGAINERDFRAALKSAGLLSDEIDRAADYEFGRTPADVFIFEVGDKEQIMGFDIG